MSHNITVEGGSSVRLKTAGKYCDRDIIVTATGGSAPDPVLKDCIEGNAVEINSDAVAQVRTYAFYKADNLVAVSFPNAVSTAAYAFTDCTGLISADLPNVTSTTGTYLFDGCTALKNVNLPKVASISNYTFRDCSSLEKIELGNISSIGSYAFSGASSLETVIIRRPGTKVTTLNSTNAFNSTPIASGTGYIYFYRACVELHKSANGWKNYADQIRAIEDYPEITGG